MESEVGKLRSVLARRESGAAAAVHRKWGGGCRTRRTTPYTAPGLVEFVVEFEPEGGSSGWLSPTGAVQEAWPVHRTGVG